MSIKGIDISHWQTSTPSLTGLDFLGARATYAATPDDKYAMHYQHARAAHLVIAAYHFGVPATQSPIKTQALAFIKAAGNADFLFLDLEKNGTSPSMSLAEGRDFIAAVKQYDTKKRYIGLYHSASGFPSLGQDYNWIADWSATAPARWTFWQYRGSPLDLNLYNGTRAQLDAWIKAKLPKPVPAPVPAPIPPAPAPAPVPEPQPVPVPDPVPPVPAPDPEPLPDPVPVPVPPAPIPDPVPDPEPVPPPIVLPPDPTPMQHGSPSFLQALYLVLRKLIDWASRPH